MTRSCCPAKPNQFFLGFASQNPVLQTYPAPHWRSVSHLVPVGLALASVHRSSMHDPDWQSLSNPHVAAEPFLAVPPHPGRSGGHSVVSPPAHRCGARLPGRRGGSPAIWFLIATRRGAFLLPADARTSPSAPRTWM